MTDTFSAMAAIIDANINRLAEGLRAIEEYTRFIAKNKPLTDQLADLRHCIRQHPCNRVVHLSADERVTISGLRNPRPNAPIGPPYYALISAV